MSQQNTVTAENIAARIAAAHSGEDAEFLNAFCDNPSLREIMWFLEWKERQPGRIEKFAPGVVEDFTPLFGPAFLHGDLGKITLSQRLQLFEILPAAIKRELIPISKWVTNEGCRIACATWDEDDNVDTLSRRRDMSGWYASRHEPAEEKQFRALLQRIDLAAVREAVLKTARAELASWLRSLCSPGTGIPFAPWYCEDIFNVLTQTLDLHAHRAGLEIARTELVQTVFENLDFAAANKRLIKFDGPARSGKTMAIEKYAQMWPGRARLVSCPSGYSLRDLYAAFAEALGIPFTPSTAIHKLKERVQFVLSWFHCLVIIDEAHFALPIPQSRNASPARLDWLRTSVVDKRIPLALVTTAQAFTRALDKFSRHTGYNFDQVLGRIDLNVPLRGELSDGDLLEVVKIHAAGIPEKLHRLIVAKCIQHGGLLKSIEAICCRARHLAGLENKSSVDQPHLETAISEVLPAAAAPPRPHPAAIAPAATKHPVATKRGRTVTTPSRSIQPAPALDAPARQVTPAIEPLTIV